MAKKVFLGGTCNESKWRDKLIPLLKIDYFNPIVRNWTQECKAEERKQRKECDFCLYVITPKMTGVYSIAEVVDDSNKRPNTTYFTLLEYDEDDKFTKPQLKSLNEVKAMVHDNGGYVFSNLLSVAMALNAAGELKNGN